MENPSSIPFQSQPSPEQAPEAAAQGALTATLRRNIYTWHRMIGLITIIPVMFWSLSGLMHPFLSHWFKPTIAHEFMPAKALDKSQIRLSVQDVLKPNRITDLKNFRLVQFNNSTFYQVKTVDDKLRYFNAGDGAELQDADKQYAEYLARYFLEDKSSAIKSITLQTSFGQQYKYINRYLPVWKVSFDRADHMDVYVETSSSRLGTFNTTSRKVFLWVFDNFHNWSFLEKITNNTLRIMIMVVLLGIILTSAVTGILIYGLFWSRFKKLNKTNEKKGVRRYHRQIGVATAFVALTFTFSGAFHATRKLQPNLLPELAYAPIIKTDELTVASLDLPLDWERLHNLSVVRKSKKDYFQAFYTKTEDESAETVYLGAVDSAIWQNGNIEYAEFLGKKFLQVLANNTTMSAACCEEVGEVAQSGVDEDATLLKAEVVPKFENREYGFVFKRLPVVRLQYDTPDESALYVETATSRLAAAINSTDRIEGYSFAIFHKYLLLDWAGKDVRDITMMIAALGLFVVSILGLLVFIKNT